MKNEKQAEEKDSLGHICKNLFRTIPNQVHLLVNMSRGNVCWWFALSSIFSRVYKFMSTFFFFFFHTTNEIAVAREIPTSNCGRIFVFYQVEM